MSEVRGIRLFGIRSHGRRQAWAGAVTVMAVAASVVAVTGPGAGEAEASLEWPGVDATHPETVSADALPTVQIDGVVWAQEIVGDTVFVGGNFTTARPPSGQGNTQTPRSNFLAYNLSTGLLRTDINFPANGQVRVIKASADGSRIYVGGDFTSFGGQSRSRIAAIDVATMTLSPTFRPNVGYHVHDIDTTASTVYVAGNFQNVGAQERLRLAAFDTAGVLQSWAPSVPDRTVAAIEVSPDGTKVAIGGYFETLNGTSSFGRGFAFVDATSGATLPVPASQYIRNGGPDGAILSFDGDGENVYGSGYTFGRSAGTIEGIFAVSWADGTLTWVNDCHGDTYSVYAGAPGEVYGAGHTHYCGNIGGYGQSTTDQAQWDFRRGIAYSKQVTGTVGTERLGYTNFAGRPRTDLLNWFPEINAGTFTGLTQGPWSVTGNERYVVMGGEFTRVNGSNQQGLVRFQRRQFASNDQGPQLFNDSYPIKVRSFEAGTVTLSWIANQDRDDADLEYSVFRRTGTTGNGTQIHTRQVTAPDWNRPVMTWTDTSANPGANYQYRVQVTDGYGNFANSFWTSISVPTTGAASDYLQAVLASEPDSFWRLGTDGTDLVGWRDAVVPASGVTFGVAGANGDDAGAQFNGATNTFLATQTFEHPPQVLSLEAWFKAPPGANGGLIAGFNNSNSGTGSTSAHDRTLYMDTAGRIRFAVNPDSATTVGGEGDYRDDQWHHVVGTLGSDGLAMYIDGQLVAIDAETDYARTGYFGYWRIGGGALNGFPSTNTNTGRWFDGTLDDVALYRKALTTADVLAHYTASGRTPNLPTDPYGLAVHGESPFLFWRLDDLAAATKAIDSSVNRRDGNYTPAGHTKGAAGALAGPVGTAVAFGGTTGRVTAPSSIQAPQVYSQELWFKTTSTTEGKLIGFGNQTGSTNSSSYDRHIYLQADGKLVFGTSTTGATNSNQTQLANQNRITTPLAYNDGAWHHVVSTQGADGLKLYVDGVLVGTHAATSARSYNGYWRIGGDTTWNVGAGSISAPFNGTIDEVAIYNQVLPAETVHQHYVVGSGNVPNLAPTASLTGSVDAIDGQTATLDGSASTDSDGTIVEYRWTFGDGTPEVTSATGVTVHNYAGPGTFTVTLTVVDDDGATGQTTFDVTTFGPNAAPSAAFGVFADALAVSVDAAGSTDSDGTIVEYRWDFGDGTPVVTGPDAVVPHTYAAAGSYDVTLTVTDDRGGSSSIVQAVVANEIPDVPPPPIATVAVDTFERVVASGLGTADTGGNWTISGGVTNASTGSGTGNLRMNATSSGPSAFLNSVSATNVDLTVRVALDKAGTGGGTYVSAAARRVSSTNDYRIKLRYMPNGSVQAFLVRFANGTETNLATSNAVPGLTATPGGDVQIRFSVTGTNPTQLQAKVWASGAAEPAGWLLTAQDSTAQLQAAGAVGFITYLSGSSTNAPVTASFDNLNVVDPTVALNADPAPRFTSAIGGLAVTFDGSSTVDDGTIASWAWDFGDGDTSTTGPSVSHTFDFGGTYPVTLTVTDDDGATESITLGVAVWGEPAPNVAPVASFDITSQSALDVSLDGTASSDDDEIVAWLWSFGDGSTSTDVGTTSHTYAAPGSYTITLRVTDGDGEFHETSETIEATAPNVAPVAAFTTTIDELWVSFDGSASFDDAGVVSWLWDFGDGTSSTQASAVEHTYSATGTYHATLLVTDAEGASHEVGQDVSVTAPNVAPTVSFVPTITNLSVAFDGTGVDTDGTIASWSWDFGDGTGSTDGADVSHTYVAAGTYIVSVVVTDNSGASSLPSTQEVIVTDPPPDNQAPSGSFSYEATNLTVDFESAGIDPDGVVTGWSWNFGDGTTSTAGPDVSHTYAAPGSYDVTLIVTDNNGASSTPFVDDVTVTAPPNEAPTGSFTWTANNLAVDFVGAGDDPDGTVTGWSWNFGDGASSTEGPNVSHSYATGGTYPVSLVVTDDDGASSIAFAADVTVTAPPNVAPTASFTSTVNNLSVDFVGVGNDSDGTVTGWSWNFGDGATSTEGPNVSHVYASAGTYPVTLIVTDDDGASSVVFQADVTATAPVAWFGADAFERTASNGWGTADIGGAWTLQGAATSFSVSGGSGRIAGASAANRAAYLTGASQPDADIVVDVTIDRASTGGGAYFSVIGRRVANNYDYRAKLRYQSDGTVAVYLVRNLNGVETTLNWTTVPALTVVPGEALRVRMVVDGESPTTISAKVWRASQAEPAAWLVTTTDSSAGLQQSGHVGALLYTSGSWTGTLPTFLVDDLTVRRAD